MKYKHILFDWGNTLMVDFKNMSGPMCNWDRVEAVPDAKTVLQQLSKHSNCYVATNAGDSSGNKVLKALARVNLSRFITKVFSSSDIGVEKPSTDFFSFILSELKCTPEQIVMIGDSLTNDVYAPQKLGIQGIWFNPGRQKVPQEVKSIHSLTELL